MKYQNEFYSVLNRSLRVSVSFLMLSMAGCALAFALGVPMQELAIAVTVPLLWLFAISRVLVNSLPGNSPKPKPVPRDELPLFISCSALVLSGIWAMVFFLSAVTFKELGLSDLASGSFGLAGAIGEICAATLLLAILLVMQVVFGDPVSTLINVVRRILALPSALADALSPLNRLHHFR